MRQRRRTLVVTLALIGLASLTPVAAPPGAADPATSADVSCTW